MKLGSTSVLKGVIGFIGAVVLALCLYALPGFIVPEVKSNDFDYGWMFVGMYLPAIPFFMALVQAWRLLSYIDNNQAFSLSSVKALRSIKRCAAAIGVLYAAGLPYVFHLADKSDAPGLLVIALVVVGASLVIAAAAAVFQKLFENAVKIKSENDLTV